MATLAFFAAVRTPAASRETDGRPPIVLISIDTLRSDRLPAYGYRGVATPAIDALRTDGILFERAYSHTPLTLPSHVSIFTGTLPTEHGVRDNQGYPFESGSVRVLPAVLRDLGYTTGGAVSAYVLHHQSGFGPAGFDYFDDAMDVRRDLPLGGLARPGMQTLAAAEPWLRSVIGRPFFFFLHLYEPHSPWQPPAPFASQYDDPYDGEIAAADEVVGQLLRLLRQLDAYDRSAVILLSDHGEGLGDHREMEHGVFLYREALQVPLIVKLPGGERAGESVLSPVQLIDVFPTVLSIAGSPTSNPSLLGDLPSRRIFSETLYPRLHLGWSDLASMIDGRFHYIEGPDPELYDLEDDPSETRNILSEHRRLVSELHRHLRDFDREVRPPGEVDAEIREQLAALGYLSRQAPDTSVLPDPKARFPSLERLQIASELFRRGDCDRAVPAFRTVLTENPGIVDAWRHLGDCLRRLGRIDESLDAFRRALDLSRGDRDDIASVVRLELERGAELLRRQRWTDAADTARRVLELDPDQAEAWNHLGVALYSSGRQQEALDAWQRAVELDPEAWDVLYNLGTKALELGHRDLARQILGRFVDAAPVDRYGDDLRRARVLLRRAGG